MYCIIVGIVTATDSQFNKLFNNSQVIACIFNGPPVNLLSWPLSAYLQFLRMIPAVIKRGLQLDPVQSYAKRQLVQRNID